MLVGLDLHVNVEVPADLSYADALNLAEARVEAALRSDGHIVTATTTRTVTLLDGGGAAEEGANL